MTNLAVNISVVAAVLFAGAPVKPAVDNDRVTVWKVGPSDVRPAPSGDWIEIALDPSPGTVTLTKDGHRVDRGGRPVPKSAVVIVLKDHPVPPLANASGYPNAFPRPHVKRLFETDRTIVWDYAWTRGEPTPMHFHDKDVVVTYLGNGPLRSTTPKGESTLNAYTAGEIRFNQRDRTHTELLESGTQRAIIVELK
jgi:hypothetical protein